MDKTKKHIINNYYIGKFDKLNYAIFERKLSKSGNERFECLAFHTRIKSLVKSMKAIYVKEGLFNEDFEELMNNLELIDDEIKKENK